MPKKKNVSPPPEEQSPETETPVQESEAVLPDVNNDLAAEAPVEDTPAAVAGEGREQSEADAPAAADTIFPPDVPIPEDGEAIPPHEDTPGAGSDEGEAAFGEVLRELGAAAAQEERPLTLNPEGIPPQDGSGEFSEDDLLLLSDGEAEAALEDGAAEEAPPASHPIASHRNERVLTIDARGEIQTQEERDAAIWHEIQNSYRTRRLLTGTLDGVEKLDSGLTLAVVNYKGFRVAIPVKEMMLEQVGKMPAGPEYIELMDRFHRILNSRLGCEIDFIVKGYDNDSRSVVASRRDAMLRKRKTFYMDVDELGEHMIYEGRVVQARVVAVAEKVIRVEVFGVETSIIARGLSWEWIGNARDHFSVGDRILVRVQKIVRTDLEHLSIQADVRSVSATNSRDNLKKCMPQCRYAGRVTDVRNGVVFIRLNNGVNAIAHSCYDLRTPGKKDDVSFAVTRLDEEQEVAIGIITRIIKQNL